MGSYGLNLLIQSRESSRPFAYFSKLTDSNGDFVYSFCFLGDSMCMFSNILSSFCCFRLQTKRCIHTGSPHVNDADWNFFDAGFVVVVAVVEPVGPSSMV